MIKTPADVYQDPESNTIKIDKNAFLRPLVEGDVTQKYADGINRPEVAKFLVGKNKSRETVQTVTSFVKENRESGNSIIFGLFIDGNHCGNIRLHDIADKNAWMGIAIFGKNLTGKGWGSKAIKATANAVFKTIGIENIFAGIDPENIASIKAFQNAGFVKFVGQAPNGVPNAGNIWVCSAG
ncbi:MAG: GNAT family N-acetyltransferase [Rhodospirillaceae bacterium]|nr:GNAT family N-acetyltransferase [Rhodospirillaceae bacterium]